MKIFKIVALASLLLITGCEKTTRTTYNNSDIKSKNEKILSKFDFYICKSIGGDQDYRTDIYGHNSANSKYEAIAKDLGAKYGLLDDCTNDSEGNIYFTSRKEHSIYKIDKYSKAISQIATGFDIALGLVYDKKRDRLYLSNWHGNEDPQYGEIEYIDLKTMQREIVEFDGNNTHILKSAGKLALDSISENLYISDTFGKKIFKYNIEKSNIEEFISLTAKPESIAVTNDKLFIIQYDNKFLINVDLKSKEKSVLIEDSEITFPEESLAIDKKRAKILFGKAEKTNGKLGRSDVIQVHSANLDGSNVEIINSPLADVNSEYYSEKYGLFALQAIRVVEK